jgi:hypothetical protein
MRDLKDGSGDDNGNNYCVNIIFVQEKNIPQTGSGFIPGTGIGVITSSQSSPSGQYSMLSFHPLTAL